MAVVQLIQRGRGASRLHRGYARETFARRMAALSRARWRRRGRRGRRNVRTAFYDCRISICHDMDSDDIIPLASAVCVHGSTNDALLLCTVGDVGDVDEGKLPIGTALRSPNPTPTEVVLPPPPLVVLLLLLPPNAPINDARRCAVRKSKRMVPGRLLAPACAPRSKQVSGNSRWRRPRSSEGLFM